MKIKPLYIFIVLAVVIIVSFLIVFFKFQDTKKLIINTTFETHISYVKDIASNIVNDITPKLSVNIVKALKNKKLRKNIEKELSLFITRRYKYIYIVQKIGDDYRFLADGSKEDKAAFLENYEPLEYNKWNIVYKTKKDIYFTHESIHNLWITYLKPIIINNKVVAILAIDFSIKAHQKIINSLNKLAKILDFLIYVFFITFIIIIWFAIVDYKKEIKLRKINQSLEKKVKEEVDKNRRKDEQLFYQSKLAQMGEMMSMIAHQWRQPLSAISATAIGMEIRVKMEKINKEYLLEKLEAINNYTQYLNETIEDFRNFFKPKKIKEMVTFEEILNSVMNIIGKSLNDKNIKINIDIKYHKAFLTFENELKQVLLNLLKNAEDIFEERDIENKTIDIIMYKKNGYLIMKVQDNAGGIDIDKIDKIFDPYFSTKSFQNGTGLGLYMSKIIIEKHLEGQINAYNVENGAMFKIIIKDSNE